MAVPSGGGLCNGVVVGGIGELGKVALYQPVWKAFSVLMISTPIYSLCWAEYQHCCSHFFFHWPPSCHMPSIHVKDAPLQWALS